MKTGKIFYGSQGWKKLIWSCMIRVSCISLLFFSYLCFSQIKVLYKVTYKPDSTIETFNTEEMTLKYSGNISYFYNETKFKLDSIYDRITLEYARTGIAATPTLKYELNFGVYKDFIKGKHYELQNISGKEFMYETNHKKLSWKIDSPAQNKQILHYNCKKAILNFGGRDWVSWFTDEIPIYDGPYKFFGLPGLILEIEDVDKNYSFSAISIIKSSDRVSLPSAIIKTTEKDFLKLQNRLIEDPALFARESVMRNKNISMKDTSGKNMEPTELYERINKEFNGFIKSHNNSIEKNKMWIK